MTDSLLIIGAGGNGRVIADLASGDSRWSQIAFLDDAIYPVDDDRPWETLGSCADLAQHVAAFTHGIVGFGDNAMRVEWTMKLRDAGLVLATIIADSASVSARSVLGPGTVVMPRAVVNIGVKTGCACLINTSASVDHDCLLEDGVHVAPGAHVGGDVQIGSRSWIGIGASVRHGMKVGADVVVGAGAAVVSDLPDSCVAVGVPARVRD